MSSAGRSVPSSASGATPAPGWPAGWARARRAARRRPMSEEPGDRAQALFDQVVDLPPGERSAFLDAACRGEPALRAEVESLLAYDAAVEAASKDSGFLESPLVRAGGDGSTAGPSVPPLSARPPLP